MLIDLFGLAIRHFEHSRLWSRPAGHFGAVLGLRHWRQPRGQQINLITAEISSGKSADEAARSSFRGLLIPGSMALVTDLVGFGTLILIPIQMIQELAITASIGVALKI